MMSRIISETSLLGMLLERNGPRFPTIPRPGQLVSLEPAKCPEHREIDLNGIYKVRRNRAGKPYLVMGLSCPHCPPKTVYTNPGLDRENEMASGDYQ
jgi:hypothetical protein